MLRRNLIHVLIGTYCLLSLLLFYSIIGGCGSSDSDIGTGSPSDSDTPKLLNAEHGGWKSQHCDSCHTLPIEDHETSNIPDCNACHGANGACDPNSDSSEREHAMTDNCVLCHQNRHGFDTASDCISCHFASKGLDDCGSDPDPVPGDLVSNCYGWPENDFTPANKAPVITSLAPGSRAIDFTLRDPSGQPHNLYELLETKPVLLVFGAFT